MKGPPQPLRPLQRCLAPECGWGARGWCCQAIQTPSRAVWGGTVSGTCNQQTRYRIRASVRMRYKLVIGLGAPPSWPAALLVHRRDPDVARVQPAAHLRDRGRWSPPLPSMLPQGLSLAGHAGPVCWALAPPPRRQARGADRGLRGPEGAGAGEDVREAGAAVSGMGYCFRGWRSQGRHR